MTDFPVDSTKSAFQRLSSVRIRADDNKPVPKPAPESSESNSEAAPVRIFNEVASRPADAQKARVAVGRLEQAVTNLDETKNAINRIAAPETPEIEEANRLAAQAARITDVSKASDLADKLRDNILKNEGLAKQAFALNPNVVKELTT